MSRPDRKPRKIFEGVDIIDTADEGLAIGRCEDGLIIQVRGAVPGDKVDVVALEKRKGMYITKVSSVTTFSPDRVEPFCSHFGVCGGCKWQHMAYDAQVRFKEKKVLDAFQRIGGLDTSLIKPIVKAPSQTYYRNKLEFTASDRRWLTEEELSHQDEIFDKNGIGFHLVGAFDKVLDIDHCYLQADPSNDIRHFVKNMCIENNWAFQSLRHKSGFIRNIIVRNNLAGDVMIVLVVGEDEKERINLLVNGLKNNFPQIVSIYSCFNHKVNDSLHDLTLVHEYGDTGLIEQLGNTKFKIGPKSFFQTNSAQAFNLYSLAKELAALQPDDNVYDLYCGVGSLGIFMADQCKQVVGIEQINEAIIDAHANAELNGFTNTHFVTGQVEMILDPGFIAKYGKPDVIITDPPRVGMHPNVIPHLLAAAPDRIVYVSCNPATQARDLKMLSDDYALVSAIPVDMFPHTHHIECVALLRHK
ncbi:MAG: 23S rRNA (uracil(1939)-C(5))-methyltransferase RlmD [Saprospiraceae bacterium]|uniref:23S rRNA (Uracil(1939)-C(5))-methyltransferase RlmD n=1 Tax=Candidatus Opimibacter skivensis TaxID=2982028 RepID=A0A9D7ST99_9BACT|nr:23S rRNA (uracil(1939)-C(5))-methyltransferase RlmD [Candidatus Opimibacter skivensis]